MKKYFKKVASTSFQLDPGVSLEPHRRVRGDGYPIRFSIFLEF